VPDDGSGLQHRSLTALQKFARNFANFPGKIPVPRDSKGQ
jgi:hypothetical protein